jgi:long-chain fatty acid transport protein
MKNTSLALRALLALGALASCALIPNFAHAGGLYLFDRGARALSRGGAFVAGADDPQSLWYNPAGLADSKNQILSDAVLSLMVNSSFTRTNTVDGNTYEYPSLKPRPLPLPIPTLAISHKLGLKDWTFGLGVFAPNTIIMGWPQSAKVNGTNQPASTRYSLLGRGLRGSILANLALGAAWEPIDGLKIGADAQVIVGQFRARQALSACDRSVCAQTEDPEYDAEADMKLTTAAITGVFGIIYDAKILRLGASLMLPYKLKGKADLDLTLPTAGIFEGATLRGSKKADVGINFPLIMRFGSELRPVKALRMEGAFVIEKWSTQKEIKIEPNGLQIENVVGIGTYDVGPVTIQRKMKDTWSLRGGMEIFIPRRWSPWGLKWALRGGLAYEKGAFNSAAMTPLTLDSDKVILSGGFGVNLHKRVRFDTVLGYMFMKDMTVTDSSIRQPQAIRPTKEDYGTPLGNGKYKMDALFLGGALVFDIN